jgi:c-di-GMP-binding flagellar brake protein YcgR
MHTERRRTPRATVPAEEGVRFELRHRVQLLDISLTGALLACEIALPLGSTARLRAGLANGPFTAELQVRREQPPTGKHAQVGLGAMFLSMDDSSRRSLEQFLRRASE